MIPETTPQPAEPTGLGSYMAVSLPVGGVLAAILLFAIGDVGTAWRLVLAFIAAIWLVMVVLAAPRHGGPAALGVL
jgi:hypothetical protein